MRKHHFCHLCHDLLLTACTRIVTVWPLFYFSLSSSPLSLFVSPPPALFLFLIIHWSAKKSTKKQKTKKPKSYTFVTRNYKVNILELPVSGARPLVAASGYMSRAIGYRPCFDRVHVPHVASFYCLHFCVLQNIITLGYIRRLLWNWDLF